MDFHHGGASRLRQAREGLHHCLLRGRHFSLQKKTGERGGEKEMKHILKTKYFHGATSPALSPGWPQLPKW